jgi:hypothetical protein
LLPLSCWLEVAEKKKMRSRLHLSHR